MKTCPVCSKEILNKRNTFCSQSCGATNSNKTMPKRTLQGKCKTCEKTISSQRSYCSIKCKNIGAKNNVHNFHGKDMRTCSACKIDYPNTTENFYRKNKRSNVLYSYCRTCFNGMQKNKHNELKQKLIDYKGGSCIICGYSKCNAAIDFHHTNPANKEIGIGTSRRNFDRLKLEVDKCIVVCRNCHSEIHQGLHPQYIIQKT